MLHAIHRVQTVQECLQAQETRIKTMSGEEDVACDSKLIILIIQILILHCLKQHHDELVDELHESRTKAVQAANRHKKMSIEMEAKAKATEDALQRQRESEEARVEERAQEMAAQMIQAKMRGNMVRKASASNFGAEKAAKMAASGRIKGDEKV